MENYSNIKKNIINKFLNPRYQFSSVYIKNMVINNIINNSWFPVTYEDKSDTLFIDLGNNINISIHCVWIKSDDTVRWVLRKFE